MAHISGWSHEELFILLGSECTSISLLLLLLNLHISVFVFDVSVRHSIIEALRVIPCLFCILLATWCSLGTRCMWKLEAVVFLGILSSLYRLHVKTTWIHLLIWLNLFALRHLDVQSTCLIFIKKIVEFIVSRAVNSSLLVWENAWPMMAKNTLVVP